MKVYKFNNCYLDTIERRVFKDGQSIEITPRAFDILQLLVESHGKLVTKADLIQKVWHDSFVEEGNIPVHISKLRKMLGASKTEPLIETVCGVGYQFVSRVSVVSESDLKRYLKKNGKAFENEDSVKPNLDSLAVLPFQIAGDNQEIEYLAEGLTESIINNLSYVPEIRVLARNTVFRFKDSTMDAQEIGAILGVAAVLTGRVKIIKENIVISAELMKVTDGSQLWGQHFNQPFSDIFEIQEKIAHSISEKLRLQISEFSKKSVQIQIPQNIKAYTQYLKGRHFWIKKNVADINTGIKYFQDSISNDPSYVASYIGLADCYISLYQMEHLSRNRVSSLVNTILQRVAEFNKNDPETLAMTGFIKEIFEWDWESGECCYQKALSLNPNNTIVRLKYANSLALRERFGESLEQLRQALLLDPLSIMINTSVGRVFYLMEQYDNALTQLKETLELDSKNNLTLMLLGLVLAERGHYAEAIDILQTVLEDQKNVEVNSLLGYIQALSGCKDKAWQTIRQIEHQVNTKDLEATNLAYIYIALGENDMGLQCLEKAFQQRSQDLLGLKVDPRLKPIRKHPQFLDLLRRIGLPTN